MRLKKDMKIICDKCEIKITVDKEIFFYECEDDAAKEASTHVEIMCPNCDADLSIDLTAVDDGSTISTKELKIDGGKLFEEYKIIR